MSRVDFRREGNLTSPPPKKKNGGRGISICIAFVMQHLPTFWNGGLDFEVRHTPMHVYGAILVPIVAISVGRLCRARRLKVLGLMMSSGIVSSPEKSFFPKPSKKLC